MNSFEKHIQDNKDKLELESVSPEIWLSIENKILQKQNRRNRLTIRWVSAIAATLLLAVLGLNYLYQSASDPLEIMAANGLNSQYLVKQVNIKTQALSGVKIPLERKEDFDLLLNQFEFLDAQYRDYLQYVEIYGYQEFIGQQIIHYYKIKIELLDKIQQEIEKINYYENKYQKNSPKVALEI